MSRACGTALPTLGAQPGPLLKVLSRRYAHHCLPCFLGKTKSCSCILVLTSPPLKSLSMADSSCRHPWKASRGLISWLEQCLDSGNLTTLWPLHVVWGAFWCTVLDCQCPAEPRGSNNDGSCTISCIFLDFMEKIWQFPLPCWV